MLEKYFVPNDRVLKLKELGFDEECVAFYENNRLKSIDQHWGMSFSGISEKLGDRVDDLILAPLFCQVFDWFRENYRLYSQTPSTCIDEDDRIFYNNPIYDESDNIVFESMEQYKTYEEAELACLDKLIEIAEKL